MNISEVTIVILAEHGQHSSTPETIKTGFVEPEFEPPQSHSQKQRRGKMATDWQALEKTENLAYFRAEAVEMSSESFAPEEKRRTLKDMRRISAAIEIRTRERFARLDKAAQTRLLDMLRESGYRDRGWWCRILMDGCAPPRPTETDACAPHPPRMRGHTCEHLCEVTEGCGAALIHLSCRHRRLRRLVVCRRLLTCDLHLCACTVVLYTHGRPAFLLGQAKEKPTP